MDLKSDHQLEASKAVNSPKNKYRGFIHVFKLDAVKLKTLAMDYPHLKSFLLLRATQRRSYFVQV